MHYLPPHGSEAREATDMDTLMTIGVERRYPESVLLSVCGARRRGKAYIRECAERGELVPTAVFYTVLAGNDDLLLVKVGPRGGATVLWNYTRGHAGWDPTQPPMRAPVAAHVEVA